ncbi:MAG TPA: VCBS repeat-containing protein [Saprospiraceae bacterium]|nr:VCBS repeat-containing protein [Saprospiraceae bacterium]HNT21700.1 VCBS repeat-containing protein [Saprospiraceae bacterium]
MPRYLLLISILFCACKPNNTTVDEPATPLFRLLSSLRTGINFANNLTYTEEFNPYTYRNFYNGGGVGLGDINNDGLLDIYFCGNQVDNKLYLNKGNLAFEDITAKAGVACPGVWSSGVAIVDVNGDGWQDIYVCKSGKPGGDRRHNELFINQGDLTFREESAQYGLNTAGLSSHAAFFDYDRDGDLDVYLLNNSIRTVGVYDLRKDQRLIPDTLGGNKLMRNEGGHFTEVSSQAGIYTSAIGFGLGVSVGDLNRDSWPDLYVSNDFFEKDYLYLNQRDGTFKECLDSAMSEISLNSMGADMADIDNDGLPEVFVTDMLPETDARYKTKTTFENWEKYQRNVQNGYHHQFIRNALQWNRGGLQFSEISRYAGVYATDWSWGALITDLDLDGHKDIFVANGIYKDLTDQDYLNLYNDPETILGLMNKENQVIKKLIDAIPSEKIPNCVFRNQGDLTFTNLAAEWGLGEASFSNGSSYGDLDNDGDPDLVVNNVNMPCFIYENTSDKNPNRHYLRFEPEGSGANTLAIGTQITLYSGDRKWFQEVHPMRGFMSCVDPRPLFGLGSAEAVDSIRIIWPDGRTMSLGHTPADQSIKLRPSPGLPFDSIPLQSEKTVLWERVYPGGLDFIHQENAFNDFERDRLLFHMISREGPALATGDVNGDRLEDLFIGNAMDAEPALFLQQKSGYFKSLKSGPLAQDKGSEDTDATFFDADGDGDLDLYVCSGGNEVPAGSSLLADRLYFNDGRGHFKKSNQILPTFNFESSSCVRPCDFDRDGDLDLFVGIRMVPFNYGVPCNGYLLENDGKGQFNPREVPALQKLGMITDAAWADFDGDGDHDLAIIGEWMPVTLLKNENNQFTDATAAYALDQSTGLWQSIRAGDLDGDGDQDLVAGNWGLNSRIKSTDKHPARLYINDFDQNGSAEQILTVFNGDDYPLTLRQDLVMQIPSLKKKYLRFESYKNQKITDVFTPQQLSGAIHLQCHTSRSGLFINQGDRFEFKSLPPEAQLSPVFSVLIEDLDRDGLMDLLLGGNYGSAKPETGIHRAQGLSIFLQNKNHDFIYNASGHALHQEVRNIQALDIGQSRHFVLAVNNGIPVVLKRQMEDK